MQDCKDESGLQSINFDFVTGDQENEIAICVEFRLFFFYFVFSVNISFLLSLLAIFFFTIYQPRQCHVNVLLKKLKYLNDFRSCDR